jgi:hypothetical protein
MVKDHKVMRDTTRESGVLAACLQYLALEGIFAWRQNQGAIPLEGGGYRRFVGMKGVSDILGILPQTVQLAGESDRTTFGNLLAIETKRPGEKLRPEQAEFLARINALGGIGICAHSVQELAERLRPFLRV